MKTMMLFGLLIVCGCRQPQTTSTAKPPPVDAAALMAEVTGAVQGESALVIAPVVISMPVVKPRAKRQTPQFMDFETARCIETPSDSRVGAKVVRCSR